MTMGAIKQLAIEVSGMVGMPLDEVYMLGIKNCSEIKKLFNEGKYREAYMFARKAKEDKTLLEEG